MEGKLNGNSGPRNARRVAIKFTRREPLQAEDDLVERIKKLALKNAYNPVTSFDDMNLCPQLLKGICSHGLEKPATCQQNIILPLIEGRDLICQAQSGMGKTAAFCIAILQRIYLNPNTKALVLAPTRELAEQILNEFQVFGQHMGLKYLSCIGKLTSASDNIAEALIGNFKIAVATLGRLSHLVRDKALDLETFSMFVIDEADKTVMESEIPDLQSIIGGIAAHCQVIVTSATMPSYAYDTCESFMRAPFPFLLKNDQLTLAGIQQYHVNVGTEEGKLGTMDELFPFLKEARGITFCNTRSMAEWLTKQMKARGHVNLSEMTGTLPQNERLNNLSDFKAGVIPTLIASDLIGRGVDIHHAQLVVNYDLPEKKEEYIHRIGRAGRYGKKGIAISFVTDEQVEKLKELETFYDTVIPPLTAAIGDLMNKLK